MKRKWRSKEVAAITLDILTIIVAAATVLIVILNWSEGNEREQ